MSEPEPEKFQVPVVWVGVDDVPVLAANQMVVQFSARDEFQLTFGHLSPPILLGDESQRLEQARGMTFVQVNPVARVAFNRQRLQELIRILQENLAAHDETMGE